MTAMRKALKDAGVVSPGDRLETAAREAIEGSDRNTEAAKDAFLRTVRADPDLYQALMQPYEDMASRAFLHKMAVETAARGLCRVDAHTTCAPRNHPASAGSRPGQIISEAQRSTARSATHPSKDGGGGQETRADHRRVAPAINPPRVPIALVASVKREILLDEIMPNGKRFRDCTKSELEGMGASLGRKAHRCTAVAAQLTAPGQTVNDAGITEDELRRVDAAWNGE